MMNFFNRTKGSISVFLILVLMPMYTCVYFAVDTARYTAAETKVNGAMKLAGNAALAGYDENLKKIYGILAMSQDEESLVNELTEYFSNTIDAADMPFLSYLFENTVFTETAEFSASYVSDSTLVNSKILDEEIRSFMKYRAPLKIAGGTAEKLSAFTQMSEIASIFKCGTDYKEAISSADGALTAVFDSLPTSSETNIETLKTSLTGALNALPELRERLNSTSDKSEDVLNAISDLEDSEIKTVLQSEYKSLSEILSTKSVDSLGDALKNDLKKLEGLSQNNENATDMVSDLSYLKSDLYDFMFNTYGKDENSVSKEGAESITENMDEIASGGLSEVYAICNEKCNYEVSGIIQHSVWRALYGDTGIPAEAPDEKISEDTSSFDFYSGNFSALKTLFTGISDKVSEITQNAYEAEYFTEMFACLNTVETDKNLLEVRYDSRNYLPGEAEYIIFGEDWMADNISKSLNMIFAIRLLFNSLYAFSNTEMRETAGALANTLSGINGFGVLLNQNILLLTWSMAESVTDISALYKGEALPVYKTAKTWNLDINSILNGISKDFEYSDEESKTLLSMTYKDYLKLFALAKMCKAGEKEKMLKRAAGIMQINCANKDATFDIGHCHTRVNLKSGVRVGMHKINKTELYGY